jgi:hypothetical protein
MDSASHLLPAALEHLLHTQPLSAGKVDFAWRVAVGQAIQRATTVALRLDGVLEVKAADAHWEDEVRRLSGVIVARLQRLLGDDVVHAVRVEGSATRRPARGRRR